MRTVDIHEAKTHLSRLIKEAAQGEAFVITKAGKPMVKVARIEAPISAATKRLGFLKGQLCIPDDFDEIGEQVIERLFGGKR